MTVILPLFVKCCPCSHQCLMGRKYGSSEKDSGILFKGEKKNKTTRLFGKCINCAVAFAFFKVSSLQVQLGPLGLGMDPYSCKDIGRYPRNADVSGGGGLPLLALETQHTGYWDSR